MDKELKYISIIFENCNSIHIPAKYVDYLFLDEIRYSLAIGLSGQYSKHYWCKIACLELNKNVLDIKTHHQLLFEDGESFKQHLLEYHDVTHIEIVDLEDKKEYIGIPWCPDDEYSNSWEKTTFYDDLIKIEIREPMK
jgi:hypothetical protein